MTQALIANNAATTLSVAITTVGQTSVTVVDASKFPVPTGGDYFYCTLLDAANIPEIVKVTSIAGAVFTVVRAQESTAARTFTTGASVRLAITKAVMDEFARLELSVQKAGDTYTGVHNLSGATSVSLPAATTIGAVSTAQIQALAGPSAASIGFIAGLTSAVQPQIDSKAPIASPTFTGNPTAPTPAQGDNDTSIATTAFVRTEFSPIASPTFTGTVTIPAGAAITGYAPIASPVFTGNPTAPTPSTVDSDTSIATTGFVQTIVAGATALGIPTPVWVSGTTYLFGQAVYSPLNVQNYRLSVASKVSTVDPSLDSPDWVALGASVPAFLLMSQGVI